MLDKRTEFCCLGFRCGGHESPRERYYFCQSLRISGSFIRFIASDRVLSYFWSRNSCPRLTSAAAWSRSISACSAGSSVKEEDGEDRTCLYRVSACCAFVLTNESASVRSSVVDGILWTSKELLYSVKYFVVHASRSLFGNSLGIPIGSRSHDQARL